MATKNHVPTGYSYSAAVAAGDLVFLGHHRGSGVTFGEQLHSALARMASTLGEVGLGLADLVKVNVWLQNIADVPELEHRFRDYFPDDAFPARTSATTEFLDADCLVMVDGIAHR